MSAVLWYEATTALGSILSRRVRTTGEIRPEAVAYFRRLIPAEPGEHDGPLADGLAIRLKLSRAEGVMLATWNDPAGPLATSVYLTGRNPDAERAVVRDVVKRLVVNLQRGTPSEPGYDLLHERDRPLVATVLIPREPVDSQAAGLIGDAESCLAAAYFSLYSEQEE